jgi:hypothetical protein
MNLELTTAAVCLSCLELQKFCKLRTVRRCPLHVQSSLHRLAYRTGIQDKELMVFFFGSIVIPCDAMTHVLLDRFVSEEMIKLASNCISYGVPHIQREALLLRSRGILSSDGLFLLSIDKPVWALTRSSY